jgi:hypothetical protein
VVVVQFEFSQVKRWDKTVGMATKRKPVQAAKPKPTKKTTRGDFSQAVARIVREATEKD